VVSHKERAGMKKSSMEITRNIESIMRIFRHAKFIAESEKNIPVLLQKLDEVILEFRSVAHEAAAMTCALVDIDSSNELNLWKAFISETANQHASQVHAGLGWAFAQKNIFPSSIVHTLNPLMTIKVADGYGYYEGIFRQNESIYNKKVPQNIDSVFHPGYNQGLGRALYYNCKGEYERLTEMIETFTSSRKAELWRGAGIAFVYVGGFDEHDLHTFSSSAGEYMPQLSLAAAMVARARHDAGAMNNYTMNACDAWCNCSADEVVSITKKNEIGISTTANAYNEWLALIADDLQIISACAE
jgi:hypothetical protein